MTANYWYYVTNYDQTDLPQPPSQTTAGSPTADGTVSGCKAWYRTTPGDNCDIIAQAFGSFSESDLTKWNPSIGSDCSNIEIGTFYCVGVSGTPTTRTSALPSFTQQTSVPTQSGVTSAYNSYWLVEDDDTCDRIISASNISQDDFTKWNPATDNSGSCVLTPSVEVCVGVKS